MEVLEIGQAATAGTVSATETNQELNVLLVAVEGEGATGVVPVVALVHF